MNTTAFLSLEDIADNLPRYDESVLSVEMDEELAGAYEELEEDIRSTSTPATPTRSTASIGNSRGESQERTEWHNLVGFQRIGEILRDYVKKGPMIFVEGELRTRSWEDRESGQRKFRTEVVVHEVSLLSHALPADNDPGDDRRSA
jgi:single-stranded DNA-binding protein